MPIGPNKENPSPELLPSSLQGLSAKSSTLDITAFPEAREHLQRCWEKLTSRAADDLRRIEEKLIHRRRLWRQLGMVNEAKAGETDSARGVV